MKSFEVAVFYDADLEHRLLTRWSAYTMWYNKSWPGCCMHTVEAKNGTEAKKLAIKECKLHRKIVK